MNGPFRQPASVIDESRIARALSRLRSLERDGGGRQHVAAAEPEERLDLAVAWFELMAQAARYRAVEYRAALGDVAADVLSRDVDVDDARLVRMLMSASRTPRSIVSPAPLIRALEGAMARAPASGALEAAMRALREARAADASTQADRRELARLDALLGAPRPTLPEAGEAWSDAAIAELAAMAEDVRAAWRALLTHAVEATSSQPSRAWLSQARARIDAIDAIGAIGAAPFEPTVARWLARIEKPARAATAPGPDGYALPVPPLGERNAELVRGLVWACATRCSPSLAAAIGDLAVVCFTKLADFGPLSAKVGNACVFTLGHAPGLDGVAQLGRLQTRVKYAVGLRLIEKAFDAAAKRTGFDRAELDDLAVPTFGLTAPGAGEVPYGAWTAHVAIVDDDVSLSWRRADAKRQASVPAEIARERGDELKALRKRLKDVDAMLTAQRLRLEGMLGGRSFALAEFRARLLDHPLLAPIVRRLIVEVRAGARATLARWAGGDLVDVVGRALPDLGPDARVQLWHPIASDVATVKAWRDALDARGVTQPFKQAHREIYVLTDAERATETFSNRFAAHILRQHVLAALCRQRGWTYRLQGAFDGFNVPTRAVEGTDLRVELAVASPEQADAETTESGIHLHVRSGELRFFRAGRAPVRLADVPARALSEIMRDVDLFVALSSVGSDPSWGERDESAHPGYWRGFAFGALSESARTRHEVLARLIPRLRIADRCELLERFLRVRGELRTYKIHLGSANVLMEPNDQYLCIVAGRPSVGRASPVKLPFEGDTTLSLILSKALLLAADATITDPSIVQQIGRAP
jgi:hypothetical protein